VKAVTRTLLSSSSSSIPVLSAGYVTDALTDHRYRNQGIAYCMMTTSEDLARADGRTHLVLDVTHNDQPARRLCQQNE